MKGNLWKVSDRFEIGYEYYGLTEKVLMRMAREAGALYKIYTTYRVRRDLFEAYLREQYRKENEL